MFKNIQIRDVERPMGQVDLLLGLDCCNLLPNKIDQVDNLQLMYGPLGYCLRGSHELLSFQTASTNQLSINIHKTVIELNNRVVNPNTESLDNQMNKFFEIEGLGTSLLSANCENCKDSPELISKNNMTIKENRELKLIKDGLTYDKAKKTVDIMLSVDS